MENPLLDFTKKSFLFKEENISNLYRGWSDQQLQNELVAYREICLNEVPLERKHSSHNLSVLVEGFRRFRPSESLLKQCALYIEDITINDPLFEETYATNEMSSAVSALIGMKSRGVNRNSIAHAVSYIQDLKPAIETGFVNFVPLNYLHEPPKDVPVFFSENLFFDLLPEELLGFFGSNVQVSPLIKSENGWIIGHPENLRPCRGISIHFGDDLQANMIYFLHHQEVTSVDKTSGEMKMFLTFPPTPPDTGLFENWVSQSINRTSYTVFKQVLDELIIAQRMKASYLTNSTFVADLLNRNMAPSGRNLREDVLSLSLTLELPIVQGISLKKILEIRRKEGESFQSFRLELEKRLRNLRQIEDTDKLQIEIENVAHELYEVQVNEVNKKMSQLKRNLVSDAAIIIGGLCTFFQTEGIGIPFLAYGIGHGLKTYGDYQAEKTANSAFFLWKLKQGQGKSCEQGDICAINSILVICAPSQHA